MECKLNIFTDSAEFTVVNFNGTHTDLTFFFSIFGNDFEWSHTKINGESVDADEQYFELSLVGVKMLSAVGYSY